MEQKAIQVVQATRPHSKSQHLGLVDQLRGVAILLVLLCHLYGVNYHWVLPWVNGVRDFSAYGYESVLVQLFFLGRAGVALFFVLSGFCIHWSCMRWERFGGTPLHLATILAPLPDLPDSASCRQLCGAQGALFRQLGNQA